MAGNNNGDDPLHRNTHYGVELDFGDHKETSWWWGEARGFWSWYEKIDEGFHPKLVAKRSIVKNIESFYGDRETIRAEAKR